MKVLTLDNNQFIHHCHRLQDGISSYNPDLIVSIAKGGTYVAAEMFASVRHTEVLCQRPSTKSKERNNFIFKIVNCMPMCVKNWLRIIEASLLKNRKVPLEKVVLSQETVDCLASAQRVLVVDDAVDSGNTLKAVVEAITALDLQAEVKSAVFTVTTKHPVIMPEYYLYNNATLIRFPWSMDVKTK
jgi:hypoxanthine phosphoribosyltransferase